MSCRPPCEPGFSRALLHALRGIARAWGGEPHVRWQVAGGWFGLSIAYLASLSPFEWAVLLLACGAVLTAQMFNWAIELVFETVISEYHPIVKSAKDAAAGAVLVTAVAGASVFALVLVPSHLRIAERFSLVLHRQPWFLGLWLAVFFALCWICFRPRHS